MAIGRKRKKGSVYSVKAGEKKGCFILLPYGWVEAPPSNTAYRKKQSCWNMDVPVCSALAVSVFCSIRQCELRYRLGDRTSAHWSTLDTKVSQS